jgi:hypothetical protein
LAGAARLDAVFAAAAQVTLFAAWGERAVWVGRPGAALRSIDSAVGVAPALAASGLWVATGAGRLQRWPLPSVPDAEWSPDAELDVAPPIRALAASEDGTHGLVAHGEQLTLFDAQGRVLKVYDGTDLTRRRRGSAQALFHLPQRRSFVAAWPALGELWEIPLDPQASPIFDGLVHDYRLGEGLATPGYLGVRRAPLAQPLPRFVFADARVPWLAGMLGDELAVVHLDVRRRIAALPLAGARPEGSLLRRSGRAWQWWVPHGSAVQLVDISRWVLGRRIELSAAVRALQPLGERSVVLLGDDEGAARLGVIQGETLVPFGASPIEAPLAMVADPFAATLLVATSRPPALHRLDAEGRLLERSALPEDSALRGVRWLPPAS